MLLLIVQNNYSSFTMSNNIRIDAYENHGLEQNQLMQFYMNVHPEFALHDSNGQSTCTKTLEEILIGMDSANFKHIFDAVQSTRKILCSKGEPPTDLIIRHGIVPKLVTFLDYSNNTNLQFEATWALTNIAAGTYEQIMAVVDAGAVDKFIRLLSSPSAIVADQSVWALANIAGNCSKTRDIVLNANVVEGLVQLFATNLSIRFLRNITWLMANLCRSKEPSAPLDKVKVMLPYLAKLLLHPDRQVVIYAAKAISYVTDDDINKIQAVIDHGCVLPLVRLLDRDHSSIIEPSLRIIGDIIFAGIQQTDTVIYAGVLTPLKRLLKSNKKKIVKKAAWIISNITATNSYQIEYVINANVFPIIRNILKKGHFKSQKEAAWIVTNTATWGTPKQVISLVNTVFIPFCSLMDSKNTETVNVVLTGLTKILEAADKFGCSDQVLLALEEHNFIDLLEKLLSHADEGIYKRAQFIIEEYFNDEEQENNLGPGYQF
ncbi:hypothetical protein HA402_013651 [Bradysia odoriphaga]|nr:hypothetical protein HA402_013651 [Bradysia odoriphaga]